MCATIAARPVRVGLGAIWGAPTGGVSGPRRPPGRGRELFCRGGGGRPYAVPRRTRRRGDAVRGAAVPTGWGRRRAGAACACCAR